MGSHHTLTGGKTVPPRMRAEYSLIRSALIILRCCVSPSFRMDEIGKWREVGCEFVSGEAIDMRWPTVETHPYFYMRNSPMQGANNLLKALYSAG